MVPFFLSVTVCLVCIDVDSLAYLTAATHGLHEEAAGLAESLSTRLDKVTKF